MIEKTFEFIGGLIGLVFSLVAIAVSVLLTALIGIVIFLLMLPFVLLGLVIL